MIILKAGATARNTKQAYEASDILSISGPAILRSVLLSSFDNDLITWLSKQMLRALRRTPLTNMYEIQAFAVETRLRNPTYLRHPLSNWA